MLLSDKFKYHINSAHCALYFAPSKTEVSALSSMFAAINIMTCAKINAAFIMTHSKRIISATVGKVNDSLIY